MTQTPNVVSVAGAVAKTVPAWSSVWQLPVLLVGLSLFTVGVYLVIPKGGAYNYSADLDEIHNLIQAENFEEADKKISSVGKRFEKAPKPEQARFALLSGDLLYLYLRTQDKPLKELETKYRKVIELYEEAKKLGSEIDGPHLQRWADTLVTIGRDDDAMAMLEESRDKPAEHRYAVLRELVTKRAEEPGYSGEAIRRLLDKFEHELAAETSPRKLREERIWALSVRMKTLLAEGQAEEVINQLHPAMMLLRGGGEDTDLATLDLLMGKAYQAMKNLGMARRSYQQAAQELEKGGRSDEEAMAEALVGLGQVGLATAGGDDAAAVRAALRLFEKVQVEHPGSAMIEEALMGRAEAESRLMDEQAAIEHLRMAVKMLAEHPASARAEIASLTSLVYDRHGRYIAVSDFTTALAYLELLMPLYSKSPPASFLLLLARTHELLGAQLMADALSMPEDEGGEVKGVQIKPAAERSEGHGHGEASAGSEPAAAPVARSNRHRLMSAASAHYKQAGDLYLRHAETVTLVSVDAYSSSLWKSAVCYDRAHQWEQARVVYAEFARVRPDDPNRLMSMNRQGLAMMAEGQYAQAAEVFKRLIDEHANSPEALASIVPLARCNIATKEYELAKGRLQRLLDEHSTLTPASNEYREGLIELGHLHLMMKEYEPAILRLAEAVERYGETRSGGVLRFQLAEAYRRSTAAIAETIKETASQSQKQALAAERAARFEKALDLYDQAIDRLESTQRAGLTADERMFLRNAYFYRGDCAFDLGRFEQAIGLYDLAARRYEKEPASLIALVQIVNANCELGRVQQARVANERAREHLKRIPKEAFNDPSLPMSRQSWEDWYRWAGQLNLFEGQAGLIGNTGKGAGGDATVHPAKDAGH